MIYSNIRTASVYAGLLILSLALISESLPTFDSKTKGDDGISDRADGVCGTRLYSGPTGTFHSPNYPAAYAQNNIDCRYVIDVSAVNNSSRILLAFSDFNTEGNCDYVEIYQGYSIETSPRIGVFSGSTLPDLTLSNSTYMIVRFSTDYSSSNYNGFSATWTAV